MKYFFLLCLSLLVFASCKDEVLSEAENPNFVLATIDSIEWEAAETFSQRERGENGPVIVTGEGEDYTLELVLGGITEPGEYLMGTNRTGRITLGNNTYTTLDVQNPGTITITRFKNNRIEGEFTFNAQWLSSSNLLEVRNGKFSVFYY